MQPLPRHSQAGFATGRTHHPQDIQSLVGRAALHEIFAARPADATAASCFALGLIKPGRLLWVRQEMAQVEAGALYPPGLATVGLDPAQVVLLTLRDAQSVLQAGLEAARSKGLSAAIMELWGPARAYTLTASRKLVLAAKASGLTLYLIQHAAEGLPSAAETRWQVRRLPSHILTGHAPGAPAFEVRLLRQRSGARSGQVWSVEWNHERRCFENWRAPAPISAPPLFKPVVLRPVFRKIPLRKAA